MPNTYKVGFCVSGQGHLFRAAVRQRDILGIRPTLLIAEQQASSTLESICADAAIRCLRLPQLSRRELDRVLTDVCVDADLDLLVLTFDKLIPDELVHHYRHRIINVHSGLLPSFRGLRATDQALTAGVRFVGATIHEVDENIDAGPIIAQCIVGLRHGDTVNSLGKRQFNLLRLMYLQVIAWYAAGRIERDDGGRITVRDAVYGEFPISPAVEAAFSD